MKQVTLAILGAGDRGKVYANYSRIHPERAKVVAVAEPREWHRNRMAIEHEIPVDNIYKDWKDLAKRTRLADAVIIATQDDMHVEPAIAFAEQGYDILLEKPMAPNEGGCRKIANAVLANNVIFAVAHVLRYTNYTRKLKELIDLGKIGEIVSIQRLEPLGYWHQAHSFVRGNWRREDESSFMLLAKACHDIDWIRYIMGKRCMSVSSFGSLHHFHAGNKPEGASNRCTDCSHEKVCPYSARKIYIGFLKRGITGWPVSVVVEDPNETKLLEALKTGPYGRCVYSCDNDVVDHQVVNMEFEGGETASFTMTAFTRERPRETHIFGTRGEIVGDGVVIQLHDFMTDRTTIYDTTKEDTAKIEGHSGGDYWLMHSFVDAVANQDQSRILSGPKETLESHLMVFAAEKSRIEKRTVDLPATK